MNAIPVCSQVRDVLAARHIDYGEAAIDQISAFANPNLRQHAKVIGSVYLPVLAENGQSGIIYVSRSWAPLAGVGIIVKIERQSDGRWIATKWQRLWDA